MAKKSLVKKEFSFKSLCDTLTTVNPDSSILSENPYSKIESWMTTGNYLLNAQIFGSIYKGVPEGRVSMFGGDSGTGKTFLCLNIVREAQKKGVYTIWVDTEQSVDEDMFIRFGVDPNMVDYQPIDTLNTLTHVTAKLFENLLEHRDSGGEMPKILLIVDSLGGLSTDKEMKDAADGSDKADMTRAREVKKFYRTVMKKIGILKITCIMTNHVYSTINSMFPTKVVSGGSGSSYNPSITLMLSKAKMKDGAGDTQTGIIVTSILHKARFTMTVPIKFHISFLKGMNPYVGLEKYVSWDLCGIAPGRIEKGEFVPYNGTSAPRSYAVKHLNCHVKSSEIFSSNVFTDEVLEKLDSVIRPVFEFPDYNDIVNLEFDEISKISCDDFEVDDDNVELLMD